jgi:hypothetical protein
MTIRFNGLEAPAWVGWLAQDANGTWWGYEAEPHQSHNGWYENEVGRCIRLLQGEPNNAWQQTLTAVPPRKHASFSPESNKS